MQWKCLSQFEVKVTEIAFHKKKKMGHINFDDLHKSMPHVVRAECLRGMFRVMSLTCVVYSETTLLVIVPQFTRGREARLTHDRDITTKHEGLISTAIPSLMTQTQRLELFCTFPLEGSQMFELICGCEMKKRRAKWRSPGSENSIWMLNTGYSSCTMWTVTSWPLAFWLCNIGTASNCIMYIMYIQNSLYSMWNGK